jgi:hypothetical protein
MTAAPHNSQVLEPARLQVARSAFEIVFREVLDAPSDYEHISPRAIESKLAKAVISGARYSDKTAAEISREALLVLRSAH